MAWIQCLSFASTQSGPFAQPQSALIPLGSQDLSVLGSSQSTPPESILPKPRQSSPSVESDLHHADATSSTSQISTVSTLLLPSSQTVESQISSAPNGIASASQNSTVPTQMIKPPHVSCCKLFTHPCMQVTQICQIHHHQPALHRCCLN
jgi:hypothetical protein